MDYNLPPKAKKKTRRVSEEIDGIQVNYCRNPACENFGRPASTEDQSKARSLPAHKRDPYHKNTKKKNIHYIDCKACKKSSVLKSNLAISEELQRISKYIEKPPEPSCSNKECSYLRIPVSAVKQFYYSHGKNRCGSKMYKCRKCINAVDAKK